MQVKVRNSMVELVLGDIVRQETDAVVNAANRRLAPGGGVAGAIHGAAGPELWEECKKLGGCKTGEAKITGGYNLVARYVIHTVGPVYSGSPRDRELLASCYENSLKLALSQNIGSISFPALSTGVFGYPMDEAATVALKTVTDFLKRSREIKVRFVLRDKDALKIHEEKLKSPFT
jgi:Predicted phosphatase homologous to the C-terminal domain of histone macroH2A1